MDDSAENSLTEKQRHWLEHLRACEASGQGIAAYAAAHGLDARAMYTGKKILVKKGVLPRTRRSPYGANIRTNCMILLSNNITDNLFGNDKCYGPDGEPKDSLDQDTGSVCRIQVEQHWQFS